MILHQDEITDLTLDQVSAPLKGEATDDDDDIEVVKVILSPRKKVNGKAPVTKQKGKSDAKRVSEDGPSAAVIKTWSRGDDEMEPSAKMVELIALLKEGEVAGDKTIVYSQCEFF